jgi:hypothetical protein
VRLSCRRLARVAQGRAEQILQQHPGQQLAQLTGQVGAWAGQGSTHQRRHQEEKQQQGSDQSRDRNRLTPGSSPALFGMLKPEGQQQGHRQQGHQHRPDQLEDQQDQQLQAEATGLAERTTTQFDDTGPRTSPARRMEPPQRCPWRSARRSTSIRWGSCDSQGQVVFNWHIIKAPHPVVDYVVIHELAHLVHANHSRAFWRLVERHCPSFALHRLWLKERAHRLL